MAFCGQRGAGPFSWPRTSPPIPLSYEERGDQRAYDVCPGGTGVLDDGRFFLLMGGRGERLVAQHRRHGRREAPSTKGTPFRAEDRVRHGCIAFNAGLCCTCAVTGAVGACAGCSSDAPRRYAPATYSVGESATRRRPVFLNSLRGVICWLTVGVRDAGNVGLRGGGAHDSPSSLPLHVRADHRWHDWACQYTPALLPLLPPATLLVCDEG